MSDPNDTPVLPGVTPPSRRDRRRLETRDRIFEAALTLLCERDFDSVTVEMITEAADVGKGTFFNYFETKEAIVVHYFQIVRNQLLESLQMPDSGQEAAVSERNSAETSDSGEASGPIWKQFLATAHRLATIDGRNHRLSRTLIALSLTNDAVRRAEQGIGEDVGASAEALLRRGQETGEFRSDYDAKTLAKFLGHIYHSTLYEWAQCEDGETLESAMMRNFTLAREAFRPQKDEGAKNVSQPKHF